MNVLIITDKHTLITYLTVILNHISYAQRPSLHKKLITLCVINTKYKM